MYKLYKHAQVHNTHAHTHAKSFPLGLSHDPLRLAQIILKTRLGIIHTAENQGK